MRTSNNRVKSSTKVFNNESRHDKKQLMCGNYPFANDFSHIIWSDKY